MGRRQIGRYAARPLGTPLAQPDGVQVIMLRFEEDGQLSAGLSRLQDSAYLLDCIVDPARRELRFRAVPPHDERLVEAIYALGGLVWCERSRLRSIQGLAPARPRYLTEPGRRHLQLV